MHSHLCPRQVLGVRAGLYAGQLLELEVPRHDRRLFVFVETDGCYADGVSVATGSRLGKRTMRLQDYGKAAATFVDTETDHAVRVAAHPEARDLSLRYAPGASDRWHAQLEAYQVMPNEELLTARRVRLSVSLREIISRPGLRVLCESCGEEVMNAREVLIDGRLLCKVCAGQERYYEAEGPFECGSE